VLTAPREPVEPVEENPTAELRTRTPGAEPRTEALEPAARDEPRTEALEPAARAEPEPGTEAVDAAATEDAAELETAETAAVEQPEPARPRRGIGALLVAPVRAVPAGLRALRKPRVLRRTLVGVLVLGIVASAVVGGLAVRADRAADADRDAVVAVARTQALALMSVNADSIDSQLDTVLDGTTGSFRRDLEGIRQSFAQVVRDGRVDSQGTVDLAGVKDLDGHQGTVLLALSASVTNSQSPQAQPRRYRISVDVVREADRWLVAGMEFVP
jgi:Mce-associated membrane protein